MQRTLINLDSDDKACVDRHAKSCHVLMTELVCEAVRAYRLREDSHGQQGLQYAIRETRSIWQVGNGLD